MEAKLYTPLLAKELKHSKWVINWVSLSFKFPYMWMTALTGTSLFSGIYLTSRFLPLRLRRFPRPTAPLYGLTGDLYLYQIMKWEVHSFGYLIWHTMKSLHKSEWTSPSRTKYPQRRSINIASSPSIYAASTNRSQGDILSGFQHSSNSGIFNF